MKEQASPHRLCHTGAHRLLARGAGLERVASILGHSDQNTTKRYVVPSEQELSEAMGKAWD